MMQIVIENAGAQKGFLIRKAEEHAFIQAAAYANSDKVLILQAAPLEQAEELCRAIVNYVIRTGENVVLHDAAIEGMFAQNLYIRKNNIRFKEVDVSKDEKAAQLMVQKSGQQGVPQTEINGQIVVGFNQGRIDELLGLRA